MRPTFTTNLNWDNLCLKPITLTGLKPMLRSGSVRLACATKLGLRFMTVTRHPQLAGRSAKRVKRGYWEVYASDEGWIQIPNDCRLWLAP